MATNTAKRCDPEIYKNGKLVASFWAKKDVADAWVKKVAETSGSRVDWHYYGGIVRVLHLGDEESLLRVESAIDKLVPTTRYSVTRYDANGNRRLK